MSSRGGYVAPLCSLHVHTYLLQVYQQRGRYRRKNNRISTAVSQFLSSATACVEAHGNV